MSHSFWNLAFLSLVTTSSVSCFPWGDELPLFISKTVSARSPSLKCHILSVTLSSSNGSLCSRDWASVCFPFGPTCTQGSRCHESIIMLLHQECSSVKWFFSFSFLWRTRWPLEHLVPVSWFLLRLQRFYHCCFYIVSANVNSGERQITSSYYYENNFDLTDSLEGNWEPPRTRCP